jgi:TRAP-type C4-dicarboxylate transport system substrate-binding protein
MLKHTLKKMFLVIVMSVFTISVHAADWTMASGYPKSNFHTQNIMKFIDEVKANTSVNINLNENDTLIKIDAIKTALQRGQIPIGEIRLGIYGNEDPMYILAGLPFIAPDYSSAWLLKDVQMGYLQEKFGKKGLMILYTSPWPDKVFIQKLQ